jgi:CO dehydrogenase/acetyl-CoA synthase alpha subunit
MEVARQNKFSLYLDYYQKRFGALPDDWHLYIRKEIEIPTTKKAKLLRLLEEEHGWEIDKKRGRIIKARHRDGRLLPHEQFLEEYGFKPGQYITLLPRLVYKVRQDRM